MLNSIVTGVYHYIIMKNIVTGYFLHQLTLLIKYAAFRYVISQYAIKDLYNGYQHQWEIVTKETDGS
jgi:hypothetical protein